MLESKVIDSGQGYRLRAGELMPERRLSYRSRDKVIDQGKHRIFQLHAGRPFKTACARPTSGGEAASPARPRVAECSLSVRLYTGS